MSSTTNNHKKIELKTPTARVGFAVGAFGPLTHPGANVAILDQIADVRWLKGLVYAQCYIVFRMEGNSPKNTLCIT